MGKISVIIPVKNTGDYLTECLNSVINQSYQNLEIIIIDDHSIDDSHKIITQFVNKDSRVKMFRTKRTMGPAASRNLGLRESTGNFVYFLDSDDFLASFTLEILISHTNEFDVVSGRNVGVNYELKNIPNMDELHMATYKKKVTKLFKNRSIINRLINTKFIKKNNLSFNERERYFTGMSMISEIISSAEKIAYCKEALYFKRNRNNPIDDPSLMQEEMSGKIKGISSVVSAEKEKTNLNKKARIYLDNQFLNYYRKSIVNYFKDQQNIDAVFPHLVQVTSHLENDTIKNKSYVLVREIKAIRSGDLVKYKKIMKQHNNLRTLKNGLKSKQNFYTYLYNQFFIKHSVDEQLVIFESFLGKNYSDSPKYIYEYMLEQGYDYKYIWVFNEPGKAIPGSAKQIKRFSLKHYYYLAKSKYWVINARMPLRFSKRPENIYLQTWHGTPLKKLGIDIEDVQMPGTTTGRYKVNFTKETSRWDFLVSPNQYSSEIFRRAFKYDNELLEFGYPRNDILTKKNNSTYIDQLKQILNLPKNKKVILYAPTWRDDEFFEKGKYKFNIQLDLEQLKRELSDDYIIILRMHYLIANQLNIEKYKGFVFDYSTYNDISELYLVSDLLITDYSSVFFDYANLKRPIFFYTYDLEKYRDTLRGFYIDIENEVPGPLLFNTNEIIQSIHDIDQVMEAYSNKYDMFYQRFCLWENGQAASKVVSRVFNPD